MADLAFSPHAFGRLAALRTAPRSLEVAIIAVYTGVLLAAIPQELVQDSWLTLVGGREVVQHGLAAHDHLTVWTHGTQWVDQQWLAQLAFYGLYGLGGLKLVLLSHVAILVAAFTVALLAARSFGASDRAVALVALPTMLAAPWGLQMRAQSIAELLFVVLLWLLCADSRTPSRRVFAVVPILVIWANVHGTVTLGACLVALRGITYLIEEQRADPRSPYWRSRGAALIALSVVTPFASPYGFSMAGYYHRLLANPLLTTYVDEWHASTPSAKTALFFLTAFAAVWLIAQHRRRLTAFELGAVLLTLGSALWAIRGIVWFELCLLVVLPVVVEALVGKRRLLARLSQMGAKLGLIGLLVGVAAFAIAATRPKSWYASAWPMSAVPVVRMATVDPSVRVFADDRYADWLLWQLPGLRGRVAYDVRFDLFSADQLHKLAVYRAGAGDHWRRAADGYDVLAFDRALDTGSPSERMVPRARTLYADRMIGVVQTRAAGRRTSTNQAVRRRRVAAPATSASTVKPSTASTYAASSSP